jgi:hypothetical protein
MRIESKKYLYDIAHAAKLALGFIAGKTFAYYAADPMLRSAVERQLEIVGEALAQLARTDPAVASQIGGSSPSGTFSSTATPKSIIESFGTFWSSNFQRSLARPATCSSTTTNRMCLQRNAEIIAH